MSEIHVIFLSADPVYRGCAVALPRLMCYCDKILEIFINQLEVETYNFVANEGSSLGFWINPSSSNAFCRFLCLRESRT